ncbi:MAG TPA: glycosyltransferase family 39 protein [Candidatus Acidoferrales bacterium]|nr:glycosyltransferase family 39 protein [Candidatus Acidoferrales bacterium]
MESPLSAARSDAPRGRAPRFPPVVFLVAALAAAVEVAVAGRYGYHRDELYFIACAEHLAWGYVDQPLLTPVLAGVGNFVFAGSLIGFRLLPALAFAALIVITGLLARALGANRLGQALSALATALCGEYLAAAHLVSPTVFDQLAWGLLALVVVRVIQTGNHRLWLLAGLVAGIGLSNKWNLLFFLASLGVGLIVSRRRALLWSPWLALGVLVAAALGSPDFMWQALHGWPQLQVFKGLAGDAGHNRAVYWPAQVIYVGPLLTPVWIVGWLWLARSRRAAEYRSFAIAAVLVLALVFILGGKPYYPGPIFAILFAAAGVPLGTYLGDPARVWLRPRYVAVALCVAAIVELPLAVPVLPASVLASVPLQKINYDLAETIGWPKLTSQVDGIYRSLPSAQRRTAVIVTGNYGEAGALNRFGPPLGLPEAYSGNNNFWLWGPPPAGRAMLIAINVDPALLRSHFTKVREVAVFHNGLGVQDDEEGVPIYVCSGQESDWRAIWGSFQNYG